MTCGILAYGAYVPRARLQRSAIHAANGWFSAGLKGKAKGEKAMASWDEDAVTMAVDAARDALNGFDRARIGTVMLASTTLPFADRQNAGLVREALTLPEDVLTLDLGGSLKAGASSLISGLLMAKGGRDVLHLSTELRKALPGSEAEMAQGDAAAAFILGEGEVLAELIGSHSVSVDFVDHFRVTGQETDYGWESRWVRDEGHIKLLDAALKAALQQSGLGGDAIDHFLLALPQKGLAQSLAKANGIRPEAIADSLEARVGDSGTAHAGLMLAACLESAAPQKIIALLAFGNGCEVLLLKTTDLVGQRRPRLGVAGHLARGVPEPNYMKYLFFRGLLQMDLGMRAEHDQKQSLPALWRARKTVLGLVGGRCTKTGTVQFPKSALSVNPNDHAAHTQEDYPMAELTARVMSYTADNLTYSPEPPQYYGNLEFEGGGRLMTEFTDVDPATIEVGQAMRMVFRIKSVDERRGFIRYFWKAQAV